jgi:hypothetical protein
VTSLRRLTNSDARLDELIAQATVDCYNEEDQVTGLFTMSMDNLAIPFETSVLGVGVDVTVERVYVPIVTCGTARKPAAVRTARRWRARKPACVGSAGEAVSAAGGTASGRSGGSGRSSPATDVAR